MRGDAVSRANSHKMVSGKCRLPERFLRRAAALAFIAVFMLACGSQVFADDAAKAVGDQLIADTAPGFETYIVQPGDTLYSISKRYHTSPRVLRSLNSLVDSDVLIHGQRLHVPRLNDSLVWSYTVKPADTLYRIARRYGASVAELRSLNGIASDNRIILGQTILLPQYVNSAMRDDFAFGITAFADQDNAAMIGGQTEILGVNWVKLEVSWAAIEPAEGQYAFSALDATIEELDKVGVQILLNVFDAPHWTRSSHHATLSKALRMNTGPSGRPGRFWQLHVCAFKSLCRCRRCL